MHVGSLLTIIIRIMMPGYAHERKAHSQQLIDMANKNAVFAMLVGHNNPCKFLDDLMTSLCLQVAQMPRS